MNLKKLVLLLLFLLILVSCGENSSTGQPTTPTTSPAPTYLERGNLSSQPLTKTFTTGEQITFPSTNTQGVTVGYKVINDLPVDIRPKNIQSSTRAIVFSFDDSVQWDVDDIITIRMPLKSGVGFTDSGLQTQAFGIGDTILMPIVYRAKKIKDGVEQTIDTVEYVTTEIKDSANVIKNISAKALFNTASNIASINNIGIEAISISAIALTQLQDIANNFKPSEVDEGIYKVFLDNYPSPKIAHEQKACEGNYAINKLLKIAKVRQVPEKNKDTAIIFVHGWQTFSGILKLDAGDSFSITPHCNGWMNILAEYKQGNEDKEWKRIKENATPYVYRYDSDHRIERNGKKFAKALDDILGSYEDVIVVAHSMGGLVSLSADEELDKISSNNIAGIVTLATPFMGGAVRCTAKTQSHCTKSDVSALISRGLVDTRESLPVPFISMLLQNDGTNDLSSYYNLTFGFRNPYLVNFWNRNEFRLSKVYAIYGYYAGAANLRCLWCNTIYEFGWGDNDTVVPKASGFASLSRNFSPFSQLVFNPNFSGHKEIRNYGHSEILDLKGYEDTDHSQRIANAINSFLRNSIIQPTIPTPSPTTQIQASIGATFSTSTWKTQVVYRGGNSFLPMGVGAKVNANGSFNLNLSSITPPPSPVSLTSISGDRGAIVSPSSTKGATFVLVLFNDTNSDSQLNTGEELYLLDDPANTFLASKEVQLTYANQTFTLSGQSNTDSGSSVFWQGSGQQGWGRFIFALSSNQQSVNASYSNTLSGATYRVGQSLIANIIQGGSPIKFEEPLTPIDQKNFQY